MQYLPLARAEAHRVAREGAVDEDELQAEAFLALCEAARNYDPAKGPFPSYAKLYMRDRFSEATRKTPVLPLTVGRYDIFRKVCKARGTLIDAGDLHPTVERIAVVAGVAPEVCHEVLSHRRMNIDPDRIGIA